MFRATDQQVRDCKSVRRILTDVTNSSAGARLGPRVMGLKPRKVGVASNQLTARTMAEVWRGKPWEPGHLAAMPACKGCWGKVSLVGQTRICSRFSAGKASPH